MQDQLAHGDRRQLLTLARLRLEARVRGAARPPGEAGGVFDLRRGAFVSIHRHDELRGCLGRITSDWALGRLVGHLAEAVADSDPRFPPVDPVELPDLALEISVLTAPREVGSIEEVVIGRDGLIVDQAGQRGLLLPQVAVEYGWDVATFLDHTCRKAGLSAGAWRAGARIWRFEAQVFGDAARG